ncbi:uncharacterized protein LOC134655756 [Cydia amplana]|uniref:uncharacterized protein LOC134655756 n=1 Tax=Cydia amplana TaxID=1869771 RepID=UPI002FE69D08
MENNTASPIMEFVTNETLIKRVANFFNVSVANVTNQSVVQQETLFDLYEAYRTKEKEQLIAYKSVAYVVGTLIILSNLIVVISSGLILRRGQQPKSTYLLLGNVSLADTIIGTAIIFGAVIDNSMASNPLCIFQIGMIVCPAIVSIFSVGLIAVDRYFYILHGLYYQRYFNTTRVRIAIVIIWMIGLILGFMPATGWVNNELIYTRCYYHALFPGALILFNSSLSLIPMILVTILYSIILVRALKNVKEIKAAEKAVNFHSNSNETPKLRIYRGNTNLNRTFPTKPQKTSMRRCASFNAICDNSKKRTFTRKSEKSKSIGDLYNDSFNGTDDGSYNNNLENSKEILRSQYEDSKHQLFQISGPTLEIESLDSKLDILSAKPSARLETDQLQALVRLSPEVKQQWLHYFDERQITYKKVIDNLADAFRNEDSQIEAARASAKRSGRNIGWDTFYRHQEINDHLDELAAQYPNLVTVINTALSYEGRQIKYVRISTTRFEDLRKPVIIIDAMVHAREWVTTPVALYIINQLVVNAVDSQVTQDIDWVIIPLANPDGYEYTHDEDRLWRKTRSKAHPGSEECPGVDGNRNFDHYWGTSAASADPCSIIYEGPTAFSEPETRVIRDVVSQHLERAAMYISLHSYGNMFLYAWGNNGTLPSNGLALHLAGVTMATAIDALALDKAPRYVVGNAAQVLYFTTGTSRDWTRAVGVPLTYTLELPGYEYLFEVPAQYVEQIVKETWAGIAAGAHYVRTIFG